MEAEDPSGSEDLDLENGSSSSNSGVVEIDEMMMGMDQVEISDDNAEEQEQGSNNIIEEDAPVDGDDALDLVPFNDGIWYRKHLEEDGTVCVLLLIEEGKKVYLRGKMEVLVVQGSVETLGFILTKDQKGWKEVFSPKGHSSLLYIEAKSSERNEDAFEDLPDGFAAIICRPFENAWTRGLRSTAQNGDLLVGPEVTVGPPVINPRLGPGHKRTFPKMKHFFDKFGFDLAAEWTMERNKLFVTNPMWEEVTNRIKRNEEQAGDFALPEKVCAFGGKGVGKSTFCRWLINKMLCESKNGKILYVDLDPGQTEFNPPGMIALHLVSEPILGPNFTHLRQPERAIFLGSVNMAECAGPYVKAVRDLVLLAKKNYEDIPWIINTMGFASGIGIPIAVAIIKITCPTILVQLSIPNDRKGSFPKRLEASYVSTFPEPLFLQTSSDSSNAVVPDWSHAISYEFCIINSVFNLEPNVGVPAPAGSRMTPKSENARSLRETVMISYFSELIGSNTDCALLSNVPFNFSMRHFSIVNMTTNSLDWNGVVRTLIGNLVALCKLSDNVLQHRRQFRDELVKIPRDTNTTVVQDEQISSTSDETRDSLSYIVSISPVPNEVLGYAICRSYDSRTQELNLITPVPEELFSNVNTIICAGGVGVPTPLILSSAGKKGSRSSSGMNPFYISSGGRGGSGRNFIPAKRLFIPGKRTVHAALRDGLM